MCANFWWYKANLLVSFAWYSWFDLVLFLLQTIDQFFGLNLPVNITHLQAVLSLVIHSLDTYMTKMVGQLGNVYTRKITVLLILEMLLAECITSLILSFLWCVLYENNFVKEKNWQGYVGPDALLILVWNVKFGISVFFY